MATYLYEPMAAKHGISYLLALFCSNRGGRQSTFVSVRGKLASKASITLTTGRACQFRPLLLAVVSGRVAAGPSARTGGSRTVPAGPALIETTGRWPRCWSGVGGPRRPWPSAAGLRRPSVSDDQSTLLAAPGRPASLSCADHSDSAPSAVRPADISACRVERQSPT